MYILRYTDLPVSEAKYLAAKARLTSYAYGELDDALGRARQIRERGGVPWEIEVDGRILLGRAGIERVLRERAKELAGRPKVY